MTKSQQNANEPTDAPKEENVSTGSNKLTTKTHKSKQSTKGTRSSKSNRTSKVSSRGSSSSCPTSSSRSSKAATKKAFLEARLKSNAEIEALKARQSKERFEFEEEQLKLKQLQEEEKLKQRRLQEELRRVQEEEELKFKRMQKEQKRMQEEEELKLKRMQEEEELKLKRMQEEEELKIKRMQEEQQRIQEEEELKLKRMQEELRRVQEEEELKQDRLREEEELRLLRFREEQERMHLKQLEEAKLRAEILETEAVIDAENREENQNGVPPIIKQQTVSKLCVNNSCDLNHTDNIPSTSMATRKMFEKFNVSISDNDNNPAKPASSALLKGNPWENVGYKPSAITSKNYALSDNPRPLFPQLADAVTAPYQSFVDPTKMRQKITTPVVQNNNVDSQPNDYFSATFPPIHSQYRGSESVANQSASKVTESNPLPIGNASNLYVPPQNVSVFSSQPPPRLEPEIFDGNPANYKNFVDAFDALISYNVPEPRRKLFYLLRYTKGPAHSL